jgi:hypothetical protein
MNKLIKRIERIAFDMTNFNHFRNSPWRLLIPTGHY